MARLFYISLLSVFTLASFSCGLERGHKPLVQIEERIEEELASQVNEPNDVCFLRAVGHKPARKVASRVEQIAQSLSLETCLNYAFERNNDIKQRRNGIIAVGGVKIVANSRFLPSLSVISQYERIKDFDYPDSTEDTSTLGLTIRQRVLEYGKDNPIDVALRMEQRKALFDYENTVARVFYEIRRAFYFILLKERQIAIRRELLSEFERHYGKKKERMNAGNWSVKIEVLTARLNVLNEQSRINTLERQRFNRKMELLRLIGSPVGADRVQFTGQANRFGLDVFDMNDMIALALAQSSEVALAEALVAEQQRIIDHHIYEYLPDLRSNMGFQDKNGLVGTALSNTLGTWGLDLYGQPGIVQGEQDVGGLGLFSEEITLDGPDRGWYMGIQVRFPVFEGRAREGRKIQKRAYLYSLRAALSDTKARIELRIRQGMKFLLEQDFQVRLAQENVEIEHERFLIQEQLRDVGRIGDDALERFRENFFRAQDSLFFEQERLIERQENLRAAIRLFL